MRRTIKPLGNMARLSLGVMLAAFCLTATAGCQRPSAASPATHAAPPNPEPTVMVVHPERMTLRHRIEQPGFNIEAFQVAPLFTKISGYIQQWHVDIGDRVRRDQVLAELYVPEMVVAVRQKQAAIQQALAQVQQARAAVLVARAQLDRTKSQYERLARIGKAGALDRENVDEARFSYEAAKANLENAKAAVALAEAQAAVATADRDYAKTMLDYAAVKAPFDGVVTQRNINTGDYVQPAGTAQSRSLYVISQIDPVRVFVNVPGTDAAWIKDGDPVSLLLQGAGGKLFQGKVTRNARSLEPQNRTLRTEIDLPNPTGQLLPGMYMQATITVEHPNVLTLPAPAVLTNGDQTYCYRVQGGKAIRTPLQVGLRSGGRIEVVKMGIRKGDQTVWEDITGKEEIVATNAVTLSDGQAVKAAPPGK